MLRALLMLGLMGLWACDECAEDYDCPGNAVCASGVCSRLVCSEDRACPPGRRCKDNRCVETPATEPPSADALTFRVLDAGP